MYLENTMLFEGLGLASPSNNALNRVVTLLFEESLGFDAINFLREEASKNVPGLVFCLSLL